MRPLTGWHLAAAVAATNRASSGLARKTIPITHVTVWPSMFPKTFTRPIPLRSTNRRGACTPEQPGGAWAGRLSPTIGLESQGAT